MKNPDIEFLEKRLNYVLSLEQYEIAVVIQKWLVELKLKQEKNKNLKSRLGNVI